MANVVVAAWTWVAAWNSLPARPVWALVMAAIGGFALGIELVSRMIADEERRADRGRRAPAVRTPAPRRTRSRTNLHAISRRAI